MNSFMVYKPVTVEEVLEHVPYAGHLRVKYREFRGLLVSMSTIGLRVFAQKGTVCVKCGVEGKHFRVYKCKSFAGRGYLNLLGVKETGVEVLMTVDHRLPKSRGGTDNLRNLQTMCADCNNAKGSTFGNETPKETRYRIRVEKEDEYSKWAHRQRSSRTVEELTGLSILFNTNCSPVA